MRLACILFTFENNTGPTDGRTDRRSDGPTDRRARPLRCDGATKKREKKEYFSRNEENINRFLGGKKKREKEMKDESELRKSLAEMSERECRAQLVDLEEEEEEERAEEEEEEEEEKEEEEE